MCNIVPLPVDYYFFFLNVTLEIHPVDICCCTPDKDTAYTDR